MLFKMYDIVIYGDIRKDYGERLR